ncbi:hypothetical protein WJX79_001915 [Trebouxia sp. C0005]
MGAAMSHTIRHGRRPSQVQHCTRLQLFSSQGLPATTQSTFTKTASYVSSESWQQPSKEQPKEYSWLSDDPGAKKRSVDQRTDRTKRKVRRAARLF